jgi:hypothetical protein
MLLDFVQNKAALWAVKLKILVTLYPIIEIYVFEKNKYIGEQMRE